MCGYVDIKEMEGPSGVGASDGGETSIEVGAEALEDGEAYEGHATQEQYRQEMNRDPDVESQEDEVVLSDGEVAQSEDYSDLDNQGDGAWEAREGLMFDTNLASMHTYLGGLGEVDDIGNDRFNGAGGALLKLPMFYLEGIVLFPDQKLPLRVLQTRFKAAVSHAMRPEGNDAPYTLGVIHVRVSRSGIVQVATYGTTAEIRQLRDQNDGSVNVMTMGRQRFRIRRGWTAPDGALFAQVQIIKEDTDSVKHVPRAAFSPMVSEWCRSGRAKWAPAISSESNWTEGKSQAGSEEEFYEEMEVIEQENPLVGDNREVHSANETDNVVHDESEDEDRVAEEDGDRTEDPDGDESDEFFAAVAEEDDEREYSDEEDDNSEPQYERPRVRQRVSASTSGGVSAIGRRLEERDPVGREPTEGRNREGRQIAEVPSEGRHLEDPQPTEAGEAVEVRNNEEQQSGGNQESPTVDIVPADCGKRLQNGVWANAHKEWRKDASQWYRRAQLSAWPHWVYRQYDAYDLARRAADMLRQMGDHPRMEDLVSSPTALSYYVASNMPIQDHTRQELLEIDSTLARLKREIQLLEGMDTLRCNYCLEVIGRRSDMLVMSSDGAIGAYVNAHGYVHETLTLSIARGMRIRGPPQTENSWFPGYAWVLAKCQTCHMANHEQHMGWRFTAVDPGTRPRSFWGIRRTQLIGSSEAQPPNDSEAQLTHH